MDHVKLGAGIVSPPATVATVPSVDVSKGSRPQESSVSGASDSDEGSEMIQPDIEARDSKDEYSDTDSALDDDDASITTSLRSDILTYRIENGRTYHSYSESINYVLPNDEIEQDRLDLQHHLFTLTLGGKIYEAPLEEQKITRVLDAGTGTGTWAIDMGDKLTHAEVVGVDISPIQPTFVPPNVSFVIDNLEREWAYPQPFDFIFGRMLVGSVGDWPMFIRQSFDNLKSGGWIELQDIVMTPKCSDGTMSDDSAIMIWGDKILESCAMLKRYADSALRYKQQMIDAGFINVTQVEYKWPTNTWPAQQHYRDLGLWSYRNIACGLSGLSMALFTRSLGWSVEQVESLLADVKKDMKDKHIHTWWPIYVVYGQKP